MDFGGAFAGKLFVRVLDLILSFESKFVILCVDGMSCNNIFCQF